ncbi:MAG: phosphatidylinositol-specific phospholipase C/glycerophosphodiester phosphodiesterase family protein [Chitinophagaceae bacterium]
MINIRPFFEKRYILFSISIILFSLSASSQVIPLPHAYAHNDYWHKRPLFDAMDNGFTHIEADVYLRRSRLLVAHRLPFLKRKHTIEGLYLKPLFTYLSNTIGQAQTPLDTVVLMIDIKSNGKKTYKALRKILNNYKTILSTCEKGKVTIRNLTLVLTGHRPLQLLKTEESRYVFADADLRKINTEEADPEMFTTASCKYSDLVTWKGKGEIPALEKIHLTALVNKAHLSGTKVRLWAAPENETVWLFLRNCGVDLINTDKLLALKNFFIKDMASQTLSLKL